MKKKILTSSLFLGIVFASAFGFDSLEKNRVDALSAATTLCGTISASFKNTSDSIPTCGSATSLVFNFDYDYNVTGVSSGADGY